MLNVKCTLLVKNGLKAAGCASMMMAMCQSGTALSEQTVQVYEPNVSALPPISNGSQTYISGVYGNIGFVACSSGNSMPRWPECLSKVPKNPNTTFIVYEKREVDTHVSNLHNADINLSQAIGQVRSDVLNEVKAALEKINQTDNSPARKKLIQEAVISNLSEAIKTSEKETEIRIKGEIMQEIQDLHQRVRELEEKISLINKNDKTSPAR